jgi:molybdopterin/thiamine biosynthesis adenylyltransferase
VTGTKDDFTAQLTDLGFVQVDTNPETWRGSIPVPDPSGGTKPMSHLIELPEGFPFWPPKVRPETLPDEPHWHMEFDGTLCLFTSSAWPAQSWVEVDALLEKVAGWYEQDLAGWTDDSGILDLERYFEGTTGEALIAYDDLDSLINNRLNVKDEGKAGAKFVYKKRNLLTTSAGLQRKDRNQDNKGRPWAAGVDLGVLDTPVNDWSSLIGRLEPDIVRELRRLARSHSRGILIAKYARSGHEDASVGALALHVPRIDGSSVPRLVALQSENRVAAKANRQGEDYQLLAGARVAIIGCGAVGSFLAEQLARSGVGHLTLFDGDRLRHGNCIRHLADPRFLNLHKPEAVREVIVERGLMDSNHIHLRNEHLESNDGELMFETHDLVVDATADPRVFSLFEHLGEHLGKRWISVALHRTGNVARVDRLGAGTLRWEERVPGVEEQEEVGIVEAGCGELVSPTPPTSVVAAASLACRVVIDTLRPHTRRVLPDSLVETLLPHHADSYEKLGVEGR